MKKAIEKKFIIKSPNIGSARYFNKLGYGTTENIDDAHRYGEKQALAMKENEPLLELLPVHDH
jgi:hypothetical protein